MALFSPPAPFVRSFSFPDGQHRVNGGCAVIKGNREPSCSLIANESDADDFIWDEAQTAAFLAGEPVTLGWVSHMPPEADSQGAYVCCWITIDNDQ